MCYFNVLLFRFDIAAALDVVERDRFFWQRVECGWRIGEMWFGAFQAEDR
jgi:hypothetical protein